MFGLLIDCERKGGYHYYIQNEDEVRCGSIRSWLLSTISVSNLLIDNQQLKDRILLEEIPSGHKFLSMAIEAMKTGNILNITYRGYKRNDSNSFEAEPYCVKLFKQRWYMVARSPYYDKLLIYSLDRVLDMKILAGKRFKMPESFHPSEFFDECYGIITGDETKPQFVKLKVSVGQANYLRSLPLHHSQQEIETTTEYSIFELRIRPTFDFQQEILWNGENVEVLEPKWLRKEIAGKIRRMGEKYKIL